MFSPFINQNIPPISTYTTPDTPIIPSLCVTSSPPPFSTDIQGVARLLCRLHIVHPRPPHSLHAHCSDRPRLYYPPRVPRVLPVPIRRVLGSTSPLYTNLASPLSAVLSAVNCTGIPFLVPLLLPRMTLRRRLNTPARPAIQKANNPHQNRLAAHASRETPPTRLLPHSRPSQAVQTDSILVNPRPRHASPINHLQLPSPLVNEKVIKSS